MRKLKSDAQQKFVHFVKRLLAVPKSELLEKEEEYKRSRAKKKK